MFKLNHNKMIAISGAIWLAIGFYLLQLGLRLLVGDFANGTSQQDEYPLLQLIAPAIGSLQTAALLLVAVALFIGHFKGRYVLGKSARQGAARIKAMASPLSLSNLYSPKYYILLGTMVALGISMRYLGISNDLRGFIDVAIGSALINGALIYFRQIGQDQTTVSESIRNEQGKE